jgi:multidrug transporter EmrE-like cation transporter
MLLTSGLLAVYCVMNVVGLLLVKAHILAAKDALQTGAYYSPPVLFLLAGLTLYVASFLTWIGVLARLDLSVAYPTAIGLTLIFSTLGAIYLLGEPVGPIRFAGIALIMGGIMLVIRG